MGLRAPASRAGGESPRPDAVDEQLRLLARALIDTAQQVYAEASAAGVPSGIAAGRPRTSEAMDPGAASRYPPTPRGCGPAQRRRRRPPSERRRFTVRTHRGRP
jgi:hypothetical protein